MRKERDDLELFYQSHIAWDPMLVEYKGRWLMYVLASAKDKLGPSFFTSDNFINCFSSSDLRNWSNEGVVVQGRGPGERICAGNLIVEGDELYFFCSATVREYSFRHLDQEVFLLKSTDGITFEPVRSFVLQPDPVLHATGISDPESGKMMFAWRDPYPFKDPQSGSYYLFIAAGGHRWGVAPQIALARAERVEGPYQHLPPAYNPRVFGEGAFKYTLQELERVAVVEHQGVWFLFVSCWAKYVSAPFQAHCRAAGMPVTNSSVYVLCSPRLEGPYEFSLDRPILPGSSSTGLYGSQIVSYFDGQFLCGWNPQIFQVTASSSLRYTPDLKGGFLERCPE